MNDSSQHARTDEDRDPRERDANERDESLNDLAAGDTAPIASGAASEGDSEPGRAAPAPIPATLVSEILDKPSSADTEQAVDAATSIAPGVLGPPVYATLVAKPGAVALPPDLNNIAANGGAIGSFVLGIWAIVGAWITPFSLINAALAVLLGIWGLWSNRPRWAVVGIVLASVAAVLCIADIRGWIETWNATEQDVG